MPYPLGHRGLYSCGWIVVTYLLLVVDGVGSKCTWHKLQCFIGPTKISQAHPHIQRSTERSTEMGWAIELYEVNPPHPEEAPLSSTCVDILCAHNPQPRVAYTAPCPLWSLWLSQWQCDKPASEVYHEASPSEASATQSQWQPTVHITIISLGRQ